MRHVNKIISSVVIFFLSSSIFSATQTIIKNIDDKKYYFVSLSDIHFDPFESCKRSPCPLIEKLNHYPVTQWTDIFLKYDTKPPKFWRDTNYTLLISSLTAAKLAANQFHSQFVIVLGDILGHEFSNKYKVYSRDKSKQSYQMFVKKVMTFLTNQLQSTFPLIDVYVLVGNNDSYNGNYFTSFDNNFFPDTGKLWSSLIKNSENKISMQKQFAYAGYYAVDLPYASHIKLIMLNTNVFSYKSKGKNVSEIALKELNWLHSQLQSAQNNHQKVFIAMHIPEGVDVYATLHTRFFRLINLWRQQYTQRFQQELLMFSPDIVGIFAGHLHIETFNFLNFNQDKIEIPELGVPSISPVFGNNPGFQIYSYTNNPFQLVDFLTYRYDMNKKNSWN